MSAADLTGLRFGKLLVIERNGSRNKQPSWLCQCDCGNSKTIVTSSLLAGTKTCGCFNHHKTGTPEYESWMAMRRRCRDPKNAKYHMYGARGVSVCDRWNNSFLDFLTDMGERPKGTTIDRYPNKNGNYEPGNCRWATFSEQNLNRGPHKYKGRFFELGGLRLSIKDWAAKTGISLNALRKRLQKGIDFETAINMKPRRRSVFSQGVPNVASINPTL